MHIRGDPDTMTSPENTAYGDEAAEVGLELQAQAEAALAAGIEPWRMLLDPGADWDSQVWVLGYQRGLRVHGLQLLGFGIEPWRVLLDPGGVQTMSRALA